MVGVSGRCRAVRNGGFPFPNVGPVAPLYRYDCVGPLQRGRHLIAREEVSILDLRGCAAQCSSVKIGFLRADFGGPHRTWLPVIDTQALHLGNRSEEHTSELQSPM